MTTLALLLIEEASGSSDPWVWGGSIGGALIGLLGGAFGTWNSLRHTKPGREREFMRRVSFLAWGFVLVFLLGLFLIPHPWSLILWVPYVLVLVLGIQRINQMHARIRAEDAGLESGAG